MSESTGHMGSFCKESNKLMEASNYLAWKKIFELILIEQEVMEYITGELLNLRKIRHKN